MVKNVTLHSHIDLVQPQAAFSFLFGDHRFVKKYHKEVNEDPDAEVSSWSSDGRRCVKFSAPLNAPAVVKKLVGERFGAYFCSVKIDEKTIFRPALPWLSAGSDSLQVTETQAYTRSGNCFRITSDPVIENAGGERFSTLGEIILEPGRDDDGTFVTINLVLEFKAGVWGVQGTMEAFMEGQAKKSFKGWINLAVAFCEEELAHATRSVRSLEDDEAEFYDPEEMPCDEMSSPTVVEPSQVHYQLNGGEGGQHLEVWFVNAVMRELNGIQITTKAAKSHLEKLNCKMQKLEEDLQIIRGEVERQSCLLPIQGCAWTLVGMGVATGVLLGIGHLYLRRRQ